jgi:hypothetical protein
MKTVAASAWIDGLVPKTLTFEGANVDIYIGASAALIAWLSTRGRLGARVALSWNVPSLFALTNVVIRAVLTSPGQFNLIHTEVPNRNVRHVLFFSYSRISPASRRGSALACDTCP